MKLTKIQQLAVEGRGKNIIVSAGAGTGKTRVLVERFLGFVTSSEALVTEILALTYTEKAANEMKSRIFARLSEMGLEHARRDLEMAYISTIHAFAARLLRDHPLEAGIDPDFRVLESEEADSLQEQAFDEIFEEVCEPGSDAFLLLCQYGEGRIRDAVLKVFNSAHHSGDPLKEFFEKKTEDSAPELDTASLFREAGESDLASEFESFHSLSDWSWETISEYKQWMSSFSRKRKEPWPEIKKQCRELLALKLETFSEEWKGKFEQIALAFEEHYEFLKSEKGCLDFDDLQLKAIELLSNPSKIHQRIRQRYQQKFRQIMIDEFQDTNTLQLQLINLLASKDNLFFVGDYKQSVYRFRGAEPELFLEKETEYEQSEEAVRLPLLENFRTQEKTLGWINSFFETLWTEDEMPFEALVANRTEETDGTIEVISLRKKAEEDLGAVRIREAEAIAERMVELHEEEGISFGDMAVLFQAMTEIGIYEQALKKRGVPYYALSSRGFYHQAEVRDLLSLLNFLENPLADISLAAALRSPIFRISDETLFWLAHSVRESKGSLFEALKAHETIDQISNDQQERLTFFRTLTSELLALKDQIRISELIDTILERTAYELFALADPHGVRKFANLKKLIHIARDFERLEPITLSHFVRKVRKLETQDVRESEAQVEAEHSGHVVRLMSIHRSKGLEFPVVFVADAGRRRQGSESKMVLADSKGYGLKIQNPQTLDWEEPYRWTAIDQKESIQEKEEWKRRFYVAATRAKDKLIFSGVYEEPKKEKESYSEMASWMQWLMKTSDLSDQIKIREIKEKVPRRRSLALAEKKDLKEIFQEFDPSIFEKMITPEIKDQYGSEFDSFIQGIDQHQIKPARVIDLPVSAYALFSKSPESYKAVYEIGYQDDLSTDNQVEEMEPEAVSAADFGTQMHLVLERLNFQDPGKNKKALLKECFQSFDEKYQKQAGEILEKFLKSDIFKKLSKAKVFKQEIPFVLNGRHGLIYGVIDALFQDEEGKWHVLDYKTAIGDDEKLKASGYETQMAIYAVAVHQLLKVSVASGIIYFLKNGWSHTTDLTNGVLEEQQVFVKDLQEKVLTYHNQIISLENEHDVIA